MYVIPKKGFKIPDPALRDFLPAAGRDVQDSIYWQRRLNDGDVTKGSPATSAAPAPAPAGTVVHVHPGDSVVVDKT